MGECAGGLAWRETSRVRVQGRVVDPKVAGPPTAIQLFPSRPLAGSRARRVVRLPAGGIEGEARALCQLGALARPRGSRRRGPRQCGVESIKDP